MADDAAESDDGRGPSATDSDARDTDGDRWTTDDWEQLDRQPDSEEPDSDRVDSVVRDETDTDDEYRVPLDLSGDELDGDDESDAGDDGPDDSPTPEPSSTPIEPGDPNLENVVFVFLGAVAMILVMLRIMSLPL